MAAVSAAPAAQSQDGGNGLGKALDNTLSNVAIAGTANPSVAVIDKRNPQDGGGGSGSRTPRALPKVASRNLFRSRREIDFEDANLLRKRHHIGPDGSVLDPTVIGFKEPQKPGIGMIPGVGIDPAAPSGLVITVIVFFIFGSMTYFTTCDE